MYCEYIIYFAIIFRYLLTHERNLEWLLPDTFKIMFRLNIVDLSQLFSLLVAMHIR